MNGYDDVYKTKNLNRICKRGIGWEVAGTFSKIYFVNSTYPCFKNIFVGLAIFLDRVMD